MSCQILHGDCLDVLQSISAESVQCCVTSPPYWGLRDYGVAGQLGLERSPEEYVSKIVAIFREVRRVLRSDGTLWLNMGDCYATGAGSARFPGGKSFGKTNTVIDAGSYPVSQPNRMPIQGLKAKDLIGMPWRVAFALQADGWFLRQDIIWQKTNPMPESVKDRCTKAHEYLFLLSKSGKYHFDSQAISEPISDVSLARYRRAKKYNIKKYVGEKGHDHEKILLNERSRWVSASDWDDRHAKYAERAKPFRNKRSVWTVSTSPFKGAHFATFPPKLIEPCILAGCPKDGTVLDPFCGSGTTGAVSIRHDRSFIGIELNPDYIALAQKRIGSVAPHAEAAC